MYDLTKPIKGFKQEFLDYVLDKDPISSLEDMDLGELYELANRHNINIDAALNESPGQESTINSRNNENNPSISSDWWLEEVNGKRVAKFEEGDDFTKLLVAPFYLCKLTFKALQLRKFTNDTFRRFLNVFMNTCACFLIIGLIFHIVDLRFLLDMKETFIVALFGIVGSRIAYFVFMGRFLANEPGVDESLDEESYSEVTNYQETKEDNFIEHDDIQYEDIQFDEIYVDEDGEAYEDNEDIIITKQRQQYLRSLPLKENEILTSDLDKFKEYLKETFNKSAKTRNKKLKTREDYLLAFNDYIICNNPGFADFKPIERGSMVYNNLCFLLYDGMRSVFPNLDYSGTYTMKVKSLTENMLYYKLKVELPIAVKFNKLANDINLVENRFKTHEADNDVKIKVANSGGIYTFWIMKPNDTVVSFGDVLRYCDPVRGIETYYDYIDEDKYDLPILVGLQNSEVPYIFDLAKNTNVAIAGTSGSGKSWGVFEFMFNLVIQCHPGDVSFVIFDFKSETLYSNFARLPHVVGHFNEPASVAYVDYVKEIVAELNRRKALLDALGVSKWADLRRGLKDRPEDLHKFPWLFVVFEEMAALLTALDNESKEIKDAFIKSLVEIAKQSRAYGIKIIMVSQRPIDSNMPRNVLTECGVRYTFRVDKSDYERMDIKALDGGYPDRKGQALFKEEYLSNPIFIKTLGIGGLNDTQMINLLRVLAYDWQLRIDYDEIKDNFPTFNLINNSLERRSMVLRDLKDGNFFELDVKNKDVVSVANDVNANLGYTTSNKTNINTSCVSNQKGNIHAKELPKVVPTGSKINHKVIKEVDLDPIVEGDTAKDITKSESLPHNLGHNWGIPADVAKEKLVKKNISVEKVVEDDKHLPDVDMNSKPPIRDFIRKYGENIAGVSKIEKSILEKYYSKKEIVEAYNNSEIVIDEEYYRA